MSSRRAHRPSGIQGWHHGRPSRHVLNWTANGDGCTWGGSFCDSTGHVTDILLIPDPKRNSGNESYFLQGTISPALANLTHLESLDLDSLWQLSGSLPASLGDLKSLQTLRVRTNKLKAAIPSSYGGLTNLIYLDLANNKLSGNVPPTLGNIGPQLVLLDMENNSLSGAIPTSLSSLTGLEFFKLNDNKLTGEVPPALATNLKALAELNLSNNPLTGPIPQGAPFSTFLASAFAGKAYAGLCGNPLPPCKR